MNDESIFLRMLEDNLRYSAPKRNYDLSTIGIVREDYTIVAGNESVPYAFDTNADWSTLSYRKGLINPNEAWLDNTVIQIACLFAAQYGYDIEIKRG